MSRTPRATPTYDELFDAARKLGTAELLVELRPDGGLHLKLVRVAGGKVIHERPAHNRIEKAAVEIKTLINADARAQT